MKTLKQIVASIKKQTVAPVIPAKATIESVSVPASVPTPKPAPKVEASKVEAPAKVTSKPKYKWAKRGQDIVRVLDMSEAEIAANVEVKNYVEGKASIIERNSIIPVDDLSSLPMSAPKKQIISPCWQIVPQHYLIGFYKGAAWLYDFRACRKYLVLKQEWIQKREVSKRNGAITGVASWVEPNHISIDDVKGIVQNKVPLDVLRNHFLLFEADEIYPRHRITKAWFNEFEFDPTTATKIW